MLTCARIATWGFPASAETSVFPHTAVAGFSNAIGELSLVFADGSVRGGGVRGDAFPLQLSAPITGGAQGPVRGSYWSVAEDGGVFSFDAGFYGSMANHHLNQPMSAIASTRLGRGYWLVARDGGVFTFGDARFHGSAGAVPLNQPIVDIQRTPSGNGYRLVGADGGVFDYGDAAYYGSLPGRGISVSDVVGMAPTPSGRGYWIARSNGQVYAFGDAPSLRNAFTPSPCDAIAAIVANPRIAFGQGYRLIGESGALWAAGSTPGGQGDGTSRECGHVTARIELPDKAVVSGAYSIRSGATLPGYLVIDNQTGAPLSLLENGQCMPKMQIYVANDAHPNPPPVTAECILRPLVIPAGETQRSFTLRALDASNGMPLPPGEYEVRFQFYGAGFPPVAPIPIRVLPTK